MEVAMNSSANRFTLLTLALSEWLLGLPAAVLLLAAALRLLAPRQFEPARTGWVIFGWATTHISHSQAGLLFIGLPGVAVVAGSVALWLAWRHKEALRQDVAAALESLRRHFAVAILGTATLVAAAILAAVVAHLITD